MKQPTPASRPIPTRDRTASGFGEFLGVVHDAVAGKPPPSKGAAPACKPCDPVTEFVERRTALCFALDAVPLNDGASTTWNVGWDLSFGADDLKGAYAFSGYLQYSEAGTANDAFVGACMSQIMHDAALRDQYASISDAFTASALLPVAFEVTSVSLTGASGSASGMGGALIKFQGHALLYGATRISALLTKAAAGNNAFLQGQITFDRVDERVIRIPNATKVGA